MYNLEKSFSNNDERSKFIVFDQRDILLRLPHLDADRLQEIFAPNTHFYQCFAVQNGVEASYIASVSIENLCTVAKSNIFEDVELLEKYWNKCINVNKASIEKYI